MDHQARSPQPTLMWLQEGQRKARWWAGERIPTAPILFFLATLTTTTFCGAVHQNIDLLAEPWLIYRGLPFSLTLLAILGTHEFGHYGMARRHGVAVTLPYFVPAPSLIGTFGAFIRIKSLVPSRRILFDIGVAGPIAGFVVAVPAIVIGLLLSEVRPATDQIGIGLGSSLLFNSLVHVVLNVTPTTHDILLHPMAFAGWIGFLVTAFNLIPAGQLDGGHIIYTLFGRWHRRVTVACILALLVLGWFWWGWWVWAAVIFWFSGPQVAWTLGWRFAFVHPPLLDETTPLSRAQLWLAIAALGIFLLTFPPVPFTISFE
jgi:membrane-associated protease RseP (regulator of RpoE activity)